MRVWKRQTVVPRCRGYGLGQQFKTLSPPPRGNSLTVPKSHIKLMYTVL